MLSKLYICKCIDKYNGDEYFLSCDEDGHYWDSCYEDAVIFYNETVANLELKDAINDDSIFSSANDYNYQILVFDLKMVKDVK